MCLCAVVVRCGGGGGGCLTAPQSSMSITTLHLEPQVMCDGDASYSFRFTQHTLLCVCVFVFVFGCCDVGLLNNWLG